MYALLELGPLSSTGVTRLPRYYEPVRHPRRPGLSLAGVRLGSRFPPLGLPVSQQLPVGRHAVTITPVGPLDRIVPDEGLSTTSVFTSDGGLPRYIGGSAPTSLLSRPAQCSLALRPADSLHRQAVHLSRRLRRLCYLHRRADSFRLERSNLAGWDLHPLGIRALSRRTFIFFNGFTGG